MRQTKTIYNVSSNFIILIVRTILLFIVRIVFVKVLGKELLGLDSLFTNLLSALSIAEFGLNSAINYTLYKPLAVKDYDKVSSLMTLYKKIYACFGFFVLTIGILLFFLLDVIVKVPIEHMHIFYLLYLFNTISLYFISYKETLIMADQNNYKLTSINLIFWILLYVLRIIFLLITKDYMTYVLIMLVTTTIQRIIINRYISKTYNFISFNSKNKIDKETRESIYSNIKAMILHKMGNYCLTGGDNIIISMNKSLGVGVVGVYTNYLSITVMTDTILAGIFKGVTASYGNLAALESKKMQEEVFKIMNFIGFLIYGFCTIAFYFLLSPFIQILFGADFALSKAIVLSIGLRFYFNGMLTPLDSIKEATGNYKADRFVPIIQAVVNIILSIILSQYIGLLGIVLGTLISTLILPLWTKPLIIYRYGFESDVKSYFLKQIKYFLLLSCIWLLLMPILNNILISINIWNIILKAIIILLVYSVIIYLFFRKSDEMKQVILLVKKMFSKFKRNN